MKKPSSEKLVMWSLLFVALIGITLLVIHREYSLTYILSSIKKADPFWLLPGMAAMGLFFFCEGANIGRCLRLAGHRVSLLEQLKYSMAGFFFSSITPSASGGQPMQLYFMHKDGLPLSHSSLALLTELTSFQAAAASLAMAGLAFYGHGQGYSALATGTNASASAGAGAGPGLAGLWAGVGGAASGAGGAASGGIATAVILAAGVFISTAILAVLMFIIFSPSAARLIAAPVLWIVDKLNSSNASLLRFRFLRGLCEYRRASQYITKNPRAMAEIFLTSVVQLLAYFSITFCVCKSLGLTGISWLHITLWQASLYVAVSTLPFPGAVGITEGGFALMFASLIPPELMGVAIILSRLISFALPLVASGLGTFLLGSRRKVKSYTS